MISEDFEDDELLDDPIAICCYYSEYDSHEDLLEAYSNTISVDMEDMDEEERHKAIEEKFLEYTYLQTTDKGTVVIQDF